MPKFATVFLTSAPTNAEYSNKIEVYDGVAPYVVTVSSGTLPNGLVLDPDGTLHGVATDSGVYNFNLTVTDSTAQSRTELFKFTVMDFIDLSDITVDQAQFVQQLQNSLAARRSWASSLTTQTSQTLIELVSAVGTFNTSRIVRGLEDAFPETAESDSAIRATANMQGLRLSRKLSAAAPFTMVSPITQTMEPYTQFSAAGFSWFNTEQINLTANVPYSGILREGIVKRVSVMGRGTDLQAWVSEEDQFSISDRDVQVSINSVVIDKTFGGLWNYNGSNACADTTLSDGRTLIQFGSRNYGSVPGVNDVVTVMYVVTRGSGVNGASTSAAKITLADNPTITASFTSNPSGGADEKPPLAYKNFSAGTFGTYSSAVTKPQYQVSVNNYPGIIDAVTQAQREINPSALAWMNVIRVSGLTNSPWSQSQIQQFTEFMQSVTMYSPIFVWQNAVPIVRDIDIDVFCFNSVPSTEAITAKVRNAITRLFQPRSGLLLTNFYESDLDETVKSAAPGQISYVVVNQPTSPMIVTSPPSPQIVYEVIASGGSLSPLLYSYAISVDAVSPSGDGTEDVGTPGNWVFPQVTAQGSRIVLDWSANQIAGAIRYHVWGRRAGHIGKIATVLANVTSYTDIGGADPVVESVTNGGQFRVRYNQLGNLTVRTRYAGRQSKATFPIRDVLS